MIYVVSLFEIHYNLTSTHQHITIYRDVLYNNGFFDKLTHFPWKIYARHDFSTQGVFSSVFM